MLNVRVAAHLQIRIDVIKIYIKVIATAAALLQSIMQRVALMLDVGTLLCPRPATVNGDSLHKWFLITMPFA